MVIGHRISGLTYAIVKAFGLLKSAHVSLPNVLAGETLVPELLQDACTPSNLHAALLRWFRDADAVAALQASAQQASGKRAHCLFQACVREHLASVGKGYRFRYTLGRDTHKMVQEVGFRHGERGGNGKLRRPLDRAEKYVIHPRERCFQQPKLCKVRHKKQPTR